MGLFDKLTGTRHPADDVAPVPAEEVRAALLGLNRDDAAWVVHNGAAVGADLVAELRVAEPVWQTFFLKSQLTRAVRIRMRLDLEGHEVRALEEQREVSWVGNPPRIKLSTTYTRGPDRTVTRDYSLQRGENGRLQATESFRYDGSELRRTLRSAVLESGWTWRGVVFGKL
ncbi:hypothetical protein OIB37_23320 [Streptomyces sp. NBC_00820]|uniref:hypothetical protein n=1 Tax=Streptomyces sp. NBC_00820 TaxID=2975842 RepID=UPI002ED22327|nr:hypothetical protein OIB37_23320 [Streptomyces sp. NBC_00820]